MQYWLDEENWALVVAGVAVAAADADGDDDGDVLLADME